MKYVEAFVSACTRAPPDGFRPPSVAEAEEADRHVLLEIFRLMFKGKGADEAISSVICDRDAFRSLLVCVPRVVKQREVDVEKRKRKGVQFSDPTSRARNQGMVRRQQRRSGGHVQVWCHVQICAPERGVTISRG